MPFKAYINLRDRTMREQRNDYVSLPNMHATLPYYVRTINVILAKTSAYKDNSK